MKPQQFPGRQRAISDKAVYMSSSLFLTQCIWHSNTAAGLMLKPSFSQETAISAVRGTLQNVLPNCSCLIRRRSVPALLPGCAADGGASKAGQLGKSGAKWLCVGLNGLLNAAELHWDAKFFVSCAAFSSPHRADCYKLEGKVLGLANPGVSCQLSPWLLRSTAGRTRGLPHSILRTCLFPLKWTCGPAQLGVSREMSAPTVWTWLSLHLSVPLSLQTNSAGVLFLFFW